MLLLLASAVVRGTMAKGLCVGVTRSPELASSSTQYAGQRLDVMPSKRWLTDTMTKATLYLDDAVHQAIRIKAAETRQSMSDLVNDALRASLREDLEDLRELGKRRREKTVGFEAFLGQLKKDGVL